MSSKPTIILVHGFCGAAHWSRVILELSRLGHAGLHAVELPLTSLADDAERLRKMIAQQPGPVLLAGHPTAAPSSPRPATSPTSRAWSTSPPSRPTPAKARAA